MRSFGKLLVSTALVASLSLVAEGISLADPVSDEARFVQRINQDRANSGLGPLSADGPLVGAARNQSSRMAGSGSIFHNGNLPNEVPGGWESLGENVGSGASVDDLHASFMNSPSHRANVLGGFDRIGVGIVMSGSTYFVTEVFWKTISAPAAVSSVAAAPTTKLVKKCRKVRGRMVCKTRKVKVRKAKLRKGKIKARRSRSRSRRR